MSAKKEPLGCMLPNACIKACSSNSYENQDEDLKIIDVSPIKSFFRNMNLDESEYDLPLPRRRSMNSEFLTLDDEIDESGIEINKNCNVAKPTILDLKEFNYENCSLIGCISLLQSELEPLMLIVKIKPLPNTLLMP